MTIEEWWNSDKKLAINYEKNEKLGEYIHDYVSRFLCNKQDTREANFLPGFTCLENNKNCKYYKVNQLSLTGAKKKGNEIIDIGEIDTLENCKKNKNDNLDRIFTKKIKI